MTRDAVLDLLATLVAAQPPRMTEEEARATLAAWDAGRRGEPGGITDDDLPAAPGDAALAGLLLPLLAFGLDQIAAVYASVREALLSLRESPALEARDVAARAVLESSGRRGDRRTHRLYGAGTADRPAALGSVRHWQQATRADLADDLAALARLGYGPAPVPADQAQILARAVIQQGQYLDTFAVRITLGRVGQTNGGARALTEAEVSARLRTYAGVPFATFYRAAMRPASLAGEFGSGWVLDYLALDDGGTCEPCRRAERGGPYLPGSAHPTPGGVCLGRGHCRCKLAPRFSPSDYDRLTSRAAAAA